MRIGLRVAHVSVIGDVSDCISDCVYTLSIFVRYFDGEFLLDGENNLEVGEREQW